MNEKEWRQLVNNVLNNDEAAFERLYKETERSVYFLCLKLLGNEHDAKDAAHETYLAAFNGLSSLDDGANFPKWINGIAVNQCKRFFRTPQNESLDEKLEHGVDFSDDESFIPDDYVDNDVKRKVIMDIIDNVLSEVQRQTIILYYYDELKTNEIASIMNCPEGTVKYRLSAARDKIKEAVLIYEKENNERLHGIAPIPILTLILRTEAEHTVVPDIRVHHKPETSAKHNKTGGKNIMDKALKGKIIAAAAAVVILGGGITAAVVLSKNDDSKISKKDTSSSSVVTENSDSSAADSSSLATTDNSESAPETQTVTEAVTEPESKPDEEPVTLYWAGFYITLPSDYWINWDINSSERIYRIKNPDTEDAIHVQYQSSYEQGLKLEEVRDVIFQRLYFWETFRNPNYGTISSGYDHFHELEDVVFNVEDEEYMELDGCPFQKQQGTMRITKSYGGDYELSYVGYFALIPDDYYDDDVAFTVFFSTESTKPEVIEEMRETAKNAVENGYFVDIFSL